MNRYFLLFALFFLITLCAANERQIDSTDTSLIKLELKDGSILFGTIVGEDSLTVEFKTLSNILITVPHYQIKYKIPARETEKETLRVAPAGNYADRNSSHLFLMSTGRAIPAGQTNLSIYELFFPSFAIGVTDFLSVSGGVSLIPKLTSQLIYYGAKISPVQTSIFSLSIGATWFAPLGYNDNSSLYYGVGTIGNDKLSFTVGTAGNFSRSTDKNYTIFGAEIRLSERSKLMTESWFVGKNGITAFGVRSFGENIATDFGLVTALNDDSRGFPFLPWIGFSYIFGKPPVEQHEIFDENQQPYTARLYHITASYDFIALGSVSQYRAIFERNGFTVPARSGTIFGSSSSDENASNGSGIFIQAERMLTPIFSGGITISTLGVLLGSKAVIRGYTYLPYDYYRQSGLQEEHSVVSYAIHVTAYPGLPALARKNLSFSLGAGVGLSTVESELRVSSLASSSSIQKFTAPSGLLFFGLEQRISQHVSLGMRAAYFIIPEKVVDSFSRNTGTYWDYATTPPQEKTVTITLPSHSANFSFGKIGFTVGVHL